MLAHFAAYIKIANFSKTISTSINDVTVQVTLHTISHQSNYSNYEPNFVLTPIPRCKSKVINSERKKFTIIFVRFLIRSSVCLFFASINQSSLLKFAWNNYETIYTPRPLMHANRKENKKMVHLESFDFTRHRRLQSTFPLKRTKTKVRVK